MKAYKVTDADGIDKIVLTQGEMAGFPELLPGEVDDSIIADIMAAYPDEGHLISDGTGEALPEVPESAYGPDAKPLDG